MNDTSTATPSPSPLQRFLADPSLVVIGDRWHLFPTTDGIEGWGASAFRSYSSEDLVEWTDEGEILRLGRDVGWADSFAWAPSAIEVDGVHYLYFTAGNSIGVARASTPAGPYTDLGAPLVAAGRFDGVAIDPSVFRDHDGTVYLLWGNGVAHLVRLAEDLVSFDEADVHSWVPTGFREAAHLHRHGDSYFLTWSENDTREEDYRVRWAVGATPFGPWTDGGVLLEKNTALGILATGHHSICPVPGTDQWVIAYHRFAIPDGDGVHREIVFDLLVHDGDRLVPVVPRHEHLRVPLAPTDS
ncbi:family 43 glycosylhydrolase [Rathayibacter sp. VKM Ac-2803]|uniref:family 43 glycosylhydrolase n=1 Tax=unclassified Rathayibacter TaxID=2609250 RepID=UPI00135C5642|nr:MULTISPECIES: family 43 glycosylhydrolase [unclassified Rathayibacter]MWV48776.1 family 43 glycosylhydrolase [Rathayibacter sp. VKM Ac-2803]MWV60385.1 family 43 glycosylhydrolase [Rathayibacter sp. VKM Ac-2754]